MSVVALVFLTLILWVVLAIVLEHPNGDQSVLIDGMSRAFFGCLGALLGLLGGKLA